MIKELIMILVLMGWFLFNCWFFYKFTWKKTFGGENKND